MVDPKAFHRAWAKIVSDNISFLYQFQKSFLAKGMGHLQAQTLFVACPVSERAAFVPPLVPRLIIGERARSPVVHVVCALYTDYLRSEVGKKGSAPGQDMHLLKR